MENKSNSFVVTLTPITESLDLTIQSDHTDLEKEKQDQTFPEEDKLFEKLKRKLTTKELPKSFRVSLETHTAISTLATIEDMKIYEVINGVPPAFWKKTTLRACEISYSFSANPITNKKPKTAL